MPENGDPGDGWDRQTGRISSPLAPSSVCKYGQSGDVPAGPGKARDVAAPDRIRMGDGRRWGSTMSPPSRPRSKESLASRSGPSCAEPGPRRALGPGRSLPSASSELDQNVLALDPAALPQTQPEALAHWTIFRRVRGLFIKDTDCGTPSPPAAPRRRAARRGGFQSACRRTSLSIQYPPLAGRRNRSWEASGSTLHQGGERVDLDSPCRARGLAERTCSVYTPQHETPADGLRSRRTSGGMYREAGHG